MDKGAAGAATREELEAAMREELEREARQHRQGVQRERREQRANRAVRVFVGAFFVFIALYVIYMSFSVHSPNTLASLASTLTGEEMLSTLIGTLLGGGLTLTSGFWLYRYQSRKDENERVKNLREALIAELQATTDRLKTVRPTPVPDPTGSGQTIEVVLTHLEPTACEEAVRSGLFGHNNTATLTRLGRLMHDYTKAVDILSSLIWRPEMGPISVVRAYELAINVKSLEQFMVLFCETVIKGFEYQDLEIPPERKYYSDPTQWEPPEAFVRHASDHAEEGPEP